MRRITIKNLADLAEPCIGKVVADRLEPSLRRRGVAVNPVMRQRPMPEQPGPDRSLVITAIAVADAAAVLAVILRVVRRQRPQTVRGQQLRAALLEDAALHSRFER